MKLVFSDDWVRHATITNANGQVMYKVTTPFKSLWSPRTSTVWKAMRNNACLPTGCKDDEALERRMEDSGFFRLGEIEWHCLTPSRLRWFGGAGGSGFSVGEVEANKAVPARGIFKRKRFFMAPDGYMYHWNLGMMESTLFRSNLDRSQTAVAKYYRRTNFFFSIDNPKKGYLEITLPPSRDIICKTNWDVLGWSEGWTDSRMEKEALTRESAVDASMLDLIVFTYIYAEKLRKDREHRIERKDLVMRWKSG
ncbi:hypothetical protein EDB19DRAFT_1969555 [Suillus lakei]|nr:hypothetical protein EDB19DRAFT_1969555 [Suillus lakei]